MVACLSARWVAQRVVDVSVAIPNKPGRDPGEATEAAARKILVLLELLRAKAIRFSTYEVVHGRDFRSFQRDLQHLRKIGEEAGFRISPIKDHERAELTLTIRGCDRSMRAQVS